MFPWLLDKSGLPPSYTLTAQQSQCGPSLLLVLSFPSSACRFDLYYVGGCVLKLDITSRQWPRHQGFILLFTFSSSTCPQMHLWTHSWALQLLCVVSAAPVSCQGLMRMLLLQFLCVFCYVCECVYVCVSSPRCLWFCLPCQAEMASCSSEPPSWKSSLEGRVRVWPLCVWGPPSPPTQIGIDQPRALSPPTDAEIRVVCVLFEMNLLCSFKYSQYLSVSHGGWICFLKQRSWFCWLGLFTVAQRQLSFNCLTAPDNTMLHCWFKEQLKDISINGILQGAQPRKHFFVKLWKAVKLKETKLPFALWILTSQGDYMGLIKRLNICQFKV